MKLTRWIRTGDPVPENALWRKQEERTIDVEATVEYQTHHGERIRIMRATPILASYDLWEFEKGIDG